MTTTAVHVLDDPALIWQQCLFAFEDPAVDTSFQLVQRTMLDDDSWIDHAPGWLHGADLVFAELVAKISWRQREVVMYDRLVAEPRLTGWWADRVVLDADADADADGEGTEAPEPPLPVLREALDALTLRYHRPFDAIGFNLYRDGSDSVAWHADRERFHLENPTVAIVSTGVPRAFHVRPKGGGPSRSWMLGHGDLLVMGGACQHQWEHSVPKSSSAHEPRLSVMFRHHLADWPNGDPASPS